MALGASHWSKYGDSCQKCGSKKKLTRHHLKDNNGNKTGKIIVFCVSCHRKEHA